MREIGMLLWILGIGLGLFAGFGFDPSVETGINGFERVINLQRQSQQNMMLGAAALMIVIGVALHIASHFTASAEPNVAPKAAAGKDEPSVMRLAYARQIGVKQTDDGYEYDGQRFEALEDAIAEAQRTAL